jgi:Subtilase family
MGTRGRKIQSITLLLSFFLFAFVTNAQQEQHIIVKTTGSRATLKNTIQALGGRIDVEYQNVAAVAATVSPQVALALHGISGLQIIKDEVMSIPEPKNPRASAVQQVDATGAQVVDLADLSGKLPRSPADYSFNNTIIRANVLQAAGHLGQGVVVGVIDSGVANNATVVRSLAGSVIGGESFVPTDPVKSATSTHNGLHGTWVGGMIASHVTFFFKKTSCLPLSIQFNSPQSVVDGSVIGHPELLGVPLVGVAPAAKLYAFKVFPSNSGSTRSSTVIAAMDRAMTLKKNFLAGKPPVPVSGTGTEDDPFVFDSLNIQVLNLSLGGPDLFAGRAAEGILSDPLMDLGIVVSIASGNAGPSGTTVTSPGDGLDPLSMGATVTPTHDRILTDIIACQAPNGGPGAIGTGLLFHPTNFDQVADFSSRGPTADGRDGVGAVTAGTANLAQGADGFIYIISGTSFAAPTGSGAAALLTEAVPNATATEIRNALIRGANDDLLSEHTTPFDTGGGYLDLVSSLARLQRDKAADDFTPVNRFSPSVEENLHGAGVSTFEIEPGGTLSGTANLGPGDRKEFYVAIPKSVGSIAINLSNVTPLLPAAKQNQLFGDDLIFAVHAGKMTGGTSSDYEVPEEFVAAPTAFNVANPEPGFMRITFMGDSTNAGRVSTAFTMTATLKAQPDARFEGSIADQQVVLIPFNVPAGLSAATFELTWKNDWSHYPANDLDLFLVDPAGNIDSDGATLNGRERAIVKNPAGGQWTLAVVGASVFGHAPQGDGTTPTPPGTDDFKVFVYLTH